VSRPEKRNHTLIVVEDTINGRRQAGKPTGIKLKTWGLSPAASRVIVDVSHLDLVVLIGQDRSVLIGPAAVGIGLPGPHWLPWTLPVRLNPAPLPGKDEGCSCVLEFHNSAKHQRRILRLEPSTTQSTQPGQSRPKARLLRRCRRESEQRFANRQMAMVLELGRAIPRRCGLECEQAWPSSNPEPHPER